MTRQEARDAAVRVATRKALCDTVEAWGEERGVDVRELLHRMRTAHVGEPEETAVAMYACRIDESQQ